MHLHSYPSLCLSEASSSHGFCCWMMSLSEASCLWTLKEGSRPHQESVKHVLCRCFFYTYSVFLELCLHSRPYFVCLSALSSHFKKLCFHGDGASESPPCSPFAPWWIKLGSWAHSSSSWLEVFSLPGEARCLECIFFFFGMFALFRVLSPSCSAVLCVYWPSRRAGSTSDTWECPRWLP